MIFFSLCSKYNFEIESRTILLQPFLYSIRWQYVLKRVFAFMIDVLTKCIALPHNIITLQYVGVGLVLFTLKTIHCSIMLNKFVIIVIIVIMTKHTPLCVNVKYSELRTQNFTQDNNEDLYTDIKYMLQKVIKK